jgi:hypothetical protein
LRLYERLGMTPRFRYDTYERPVVTAAATNIVTDFLLGPPAALEVVQAELEGPRATRTDRGRDAN